MEKVHLEGCPFCEADPAVVGNVLAETEHFRILANPYPLQEGHILLVTKSHYSCVGELNDHVFEEFLRENERIKEFLCKSYGSACAFERGKINRVTSHCRVHYLPFDGYISEILPEGPDQAVRLRNLEQLQSAFQEDDGYNFLDLHGLWLVDPALAYSGFFPDRIGERLGRRERADWKRMRATPELMAEAAHDIELLTGRWRERFG